MPPAPTIQGHKAVDTASLRYCKSYLRRRLAQGPPLPSSGASSSGTSDPAWDDVGGDHGPGEGSSMWGHCWPQGRHEQCEELRRVLRRTIIEGESQSALLLGYTGTGKSLALDRVLRSLAEEVLMEADARKTSGTSKKKRRRQEGDVLGQGEEEASAEAGADGDREAARGPSNAAGTQPMSPSRPPFRAVYLNGMAQTDDGLAMREAVQQLGVTGTQGSNYSSNLEMAVESMKTGAVNGVPVIFVLDEFERFVSRKPQTLLYALLDLCQDKSICAAVVGLSINLTVLDVAEKRIKSRFSFRQVRFPTQDLNTLTSILSNALEIPEGEGDTNTTPLALPAGVSHSYVREFNAITRQTILSRNSGGTGTMNDSHLLANRKGSATPQSTNAHIKAFAATGRSVGWFLRLMSTAVGLIGIGSSAGKGGGTAAVGRGAERSGRGLTSQEILRAGAMLASDPHALALRSLSATQALVLVAMVRLEQRGRRRDGCAFGAVFYEYESSYLRIFPACPLRFNRAMLFKVFRQLAEQGLIRAAETGSGGGREAHPMMHAKFRSRFGYDELYQALVKEVVRAPTNVAQWCKNWQKD